MLKAERQRKIVEQLRNSGKLMATELSALLEVSEDTVRRDLQELDDQGKLLRVHGGALLRSIEVPPYAERKLQSAEAKNEVARGALPLIKHGQTLFFDGGTTTLQLARMLPADLRAMVITNSPAVAAELMNHSAVQIFLTGGHFLKSAQVTVGPEAIEQIRLFRVDLLFLGTCAIHRKHGISVAILEEAPTKRAMMRAAIETVALATNEKLSTVLPFVVAPAQEVNCLVVDSATAEEVRAKYRKLGIRVISA